ILRIELKRRAAPLLEFLTGSACPAEHLAQDVLEARRAPATRARAALEAPRPPGEGLKPAIAAEAGAGLRAEPLEGGVDRLALGVDLAGIKGPAFGLIAQNLIGAVELGEALSRLRIVAIGVRVQLLG